jgi:hypothetical protein
MDNQDFTPGLTKEKTAPKREDNHMALGLIHETLEMMVSFFRGGM